MTDTIEIIGETYTVDAGEKLSFVNQIGFDLQLGPEGETPALICAGRATVSNNLASGEAIGGSVNTPLSASGSITLLETSDILVKSTGSNGTAIGFVVDPIGATFANAGALTVVAANGLSIGVSADNGASVANSGSVSVTSKAGFGDGLDGEGGCHIDNSGSVNVRCHFQSIGIGNWDNGVTTNSGTVNSYAEADLAIGSVIGAGTVMTNTGQVLATGLNANGISFEIGIAELHNDGDIISKTSGIAQSVGLYINAVLGIPGYVTITNDGLIHADMAIRERTIGTVVGSIENLTNSGRIVGGIDLGGANDQFTNSGVVSGNVAMGFGDDVLDNVHGTVRGVISGDEGSDTITGGKGADLIYGDQLASTANDGNDLISGGKGDDSLHGGGGADILIGGAGADVLEGGDGGDVFVFSRISDSSGAHCDLILDLTADDQIDVSKIDADVTLAGNQAFHLVGALGGHAGEAALSYDAGSDQTALLLDVNGDGHADATVWLSGDQTGFTGIIL